jgi:hypothetical protein
VFEDTERLFGFQHVALVIDEDKLSKLGGRSFMRIIDDLNGRLTTSVMIQMNRDVGVDGQIRLTSPSASSGRRARSGARSDHQARSSSSLRCESQAPPPSSGNESSKRR